MISKSLFGKRLIEERNKLGLTQLQAAERIGIKRETWGKYERGVFMPGGDVLISLMDLGIDVGYLFSTVSGQQNIDTRLPESTPDSLTPDEQTLLNYYRQATPESRHIILTVAQTQEKKADTIEIGKVG